MLCYQQAAEQQLVLSSASVPGETAEDREVEAFPREANETTRLIDSQQGDIQQAEHYRRVGVSDGASAPKTDHILKISDSLCLPDESFYPHTSCDILPTILLCLRPHGSDLSELNNSPNPSESEICHQKDSWFTGG